MRTIPLPSSPRVELSQRSPAPNPGHSTSPTVVIAEEQGLIRAALKALLAQTVLNVVAEACDGLEAVELVHRTQPDVLLLSLNIPRLHGWEVLRHLREQPRTRCLVLCPSLEEWKLAEALKAGAKGLLSLDSSLADLETAIRRVAAGEDYLQECVRTKTMGALLQLSNSRPSLTKREHIVLELAATGLSSSEIAQRLFISRRTAEAHRANLMRKLRLKSQTDLVLYAVRSGIISP
jgi:DNA-binding NarL/FixJ family response regulator